MKNLETKCVQAGYAPKSGEPRITPIVQSTTYYWEQAQQVAELFDLTREGHMYSRISNLNCSTIQSLLPLLALKEFGLERVIYTTYNRCRVLGKRESKICKGGIEEKRINSIPYPSQIT